MYFSEIMIKIKYIRILLFTLVCFVGANAQQNNSVLIDSLLKSNTTAFKNITDNYKKYKIQIIYTRIDRDKQNKPHFTNHFYYYDSTNYFYCASMVKLPCSILALEKVNNLKKYDVSKESCMLTDSSNSCQRRCLADTSSETKLPSVSNYIKKMLLVSDNHAFGRIFEFLGVDFIHGRLAELGFPKIRIVHRFDGGCKGEANVVTNPIVFKDLNQRMLYQQEQLYAKKKYTYPYGTAQVGIAYLDAAGKKINKPKDFSTYNYMSLYDVHKVLQRLVFHEQLSEKDKYRITAEDKLFLMKYLSLYPRESSAPKYDPKKFHDSYKKYFVFGDSKKAIIDTNVRIYNIVGQSYGFMADCAYIVDFKTKSEFMLSAVIYANEKDVINTGKYEYNSVALPYLAELGRVFVKYEKSRKKKVLPDLSQLPR